MASAVDKQPAAARLATVAAAGCLPTATKQSQSSYTTCGDTTLRAFEAVARLGSVALAGGELSVTPGAVSRHIKELEADLGVAILERNGRGVRLTAAGKNLRDNLYPAFTMINNAVVRTRRNPRRKRMVVMVTPVFAKCWLFSRIGSFRRQARNIDIVLVDRFTESTIGDADIVVDWGFFDSEGDVVAERLTRETILAVCAPSVCQDRTLAGATLLHRHSFPHRYDFPDWPTFLAGAGLEDCEGIDPHAGISLSGGLIMDAAREGLGVALTPTTIAYDDLASGRLVRPVDETLRSEFGYWLLIPRAMTDLTEVRDFRAWLLDEIDRSVGRFAHDGDHA